VLYNNQVTIITYARIAIYTFFASVGEIIIQNKVSNKRRLHTLLSIKTVTWYDDNEKN